MAVCNGAATVPATGTGTGTGTGALVLIRELMTTTSAPILTTSTDSGIVLRSFDALDPYRSPVIMDRGDPLVTRDLSDR
jgi:hypothetical protein